MAVALEERLVLVLDAVSRRAGHRLLLRPVSLRLGAGAVCLVTGANGAGKTTLLRLAAGLLTPTTGTRWVAGPALYLRPGSGARRGQSPEQAVRTAAALGGASDTAGVAERALHRVGLAARASVPSGSLSSGERSRLAVAVALAVQPPLLCLDEPLEHLDAAGRADVRSAVDLLAQAGCSVLVASHDPRVAGRQPDAHLQLEAGALVPLPGSA